MSAMEPEDEEDPIRKCTRCQVRPRWSCYPLCRYCNVCGRPAKHLKRRGLTRHAESIRGRVVARAQSRLRQPGSGSGTGRDRGAGSRSGGASTPDVE